MAKINTNYNKEDFRDSLATVTQEGKRKWIFPKKPSGKFYSARSILSIFLLLFLFGAPFVKIAGHPLLLLNVVERHFVILGVPFGPHDLHLFALIMIAIIVSIFLFTVVYGRLFCGWICPQTVFMELVFRKIEYLIEGDRQKQKILKSAAWNGEKIFKKTSKQIIFFAISFLIANTFLSYIIGVDKLYIFITDGPGKHFGTFLAIVIFSGLFYFVFSSFREQACTLVCPYGRLQGVMLDQNSVVIHYDYKRGEPRGKLKKDALSTNGDCIDCHLCVDVCPTGIDIRNGTQLECVNCTACIDVCDSVMTKISKPKGLIRFASKTQIETGKQPLFTARSIGYTIVLVLLTVLISILFINRNQVELSILRTPGMLFHEQPGEKLSNFYDLKLINKSFDKFSVRLELENIKGEIKIIGKELSVEPQGVTEAKFLVILPKAEIKLLKTPIKIAVKSGNRTLDVINTAFLGKVIK
ncbi:MAG: cbb3-type cytochrome c oxidase accessory protein CcoG [Ignavibacteria bacterium]|nr:MAG: cbb3-type cytochrome c oxidase accessory protein CcoG [Ignavibacteria bacterium]KAF0161893.1 MAG: cbb3-type cytochrome c oxidase accessory protein CcoG [Ignavibacteria bacterium]